MLRSIGILSETMLIGIEAQRANHPQKTGVEHYARQLILHLAEIDRENQYTLYLRSLPEAWFLKLPKNFSVKVMPFPIFWTQIRISIEMLLNPVDVLMIPASALPIIHPKRSIVTIHDIGWRYFPDSFTWFMRNFLEWSTKFAIKHASKIIAVSEATKKDIVKFYNVSESKVVVIYHGYEKENPNSKFQISNKAQNSNIKFPEKFILFLSTLQPRKNLEGLIDGFRLLKQEHPDLPHKLVVVGKLGWKFDNILRKIFDNQDMVVYLNHVSDDDRWTILSKADLLVLPSFYEGFGMTILEAFAANVPVATSKISSMPEVAGEAAVYFDPNNIIDIKDAMKCVLLDKLMSDCLKEKGKERLKNFSWEKCARETLEVLKS
ncbi:MAG: glycosyltransferase family 1 protein [Candidatus Doudnabacteria bacterium]|nr:glycosyltransferase family 1 protein [Candidatus Doudnabacteria bacterium]